jgi:two-component system, OmpR family, response regulator VanR
MGKKTKKTVLIVEDDRESNANLVFFLQNRFNNVVSAYDGQEGWTKYNEIVPDLIITDIEMPRMDGLELIKKIRRFDNNTPIIILSAYSHQQYLLQAIPLKLNDYLIKPITHSKLTEVLSRFVNAHSMKSGKTDLGYDECFYDYDSKTVIFHGVHIKLTNIEIMLLELFLENRAGLISYDEIEDSIYNNASKSRNALKCVVRDLRKKIPSLQIENVAKMGYKLL